MRKTTILLSFVLISLFLSSCGIITNYYSPSGGAHITVKGIGCSTTCYVNGKMTWGNKFKIALNKKTEVEIKGKHNVSEGYYYTTFNYTLEADNYDDNAEIEISYEGNKKFGNSIKISGMKMYLHK